MVQSAHRARQGTRCDYKQRAETIKIIQAPLPTLEDSPVIPVHGGVTPAFTMSSMVLEYLTKQDELPGAWSRFSWVASTGCSVSSPQVGGDQGWAFLRGMTSL